MEFEKGFLIISIDIDVGNSMLGVINKGKNDKNVHNYLTEYAIGKIEEKSFPLFLELFNNFEIPVTFAVRGQLLKLDNTIIDRLCDSSIKHDIGSHGYYHKMFEDLSKKEAFHELNLISKAMKKYKISPKSFIFPKNSVAHLDLLKQYGYKCYRGFGNLIKDGMHIKKHNELYDIRPSLYIETPRNHIIIKKMLDISIDRKLPLHIWFHLWNFGNDKKNILKNINNLFYPLFKYAKKKEKEGILTFETMLSATNNLKNDLNINVKT